MYISFAAGGERSSETQRGSCSARAAREARIPPEEIRRVRVHATNRSLVDSLRETPLADFSGGEAARGFGAGGRGRGRGGKREAEEEQEEEEKGADGRQRRKETEREGSEERAEWIGELEQRKLVTRPVAFSWLDYLAGRAENARRLVRPAKRREKGRGGEGEGKITRRGGIRFCATQRPREIRPNRIFNGARHDEAETRTTTVRTVQRDACSAVDEAKPTDTLDESPRSGLDLELLGGGRASALGSVASDGEFPLRSDRPRESRGKG